MNFGAMALAASGEAAAGPLGGSNVYLIVMLVLMGVLMYFLMWRPQKKKEKKAQELRNSIEIGDEVTTIGGIVGRVVSIKEDTFVLETAGDRSKMRFRRWAIQEVGKLSLEGEADASKTSEKSKDKGEKADK
jgi:preprotein translocase subunit YajC